MISVIIPTYNEKNNIFKISSKLKKIKIISEIIFIDDDSNDGTYNEIIKYKSKKIKGYLRKSNIKDLSKSVVYGVRKAKYKNIVVMDCDLQHNPNYITKMWKKFNGSKYDIIIANRFYNQKILGNLGFIRSFVSLSTITLINLIFGKKTTDPVSGFFLCKFGFSLIKYDKYPTPLIVSLLVRPTHCKLIFFNNLYNFIKLNLLSITSVHFKLNSLNNALIDAQFSNLIASFKFKK